jgi:hypothetical protein
MLCDDYSGTFTLGMYSYLYHFLLTKMYHQIRRFVYQNLFAYDKTLLFILSISYMYIRSLRNLIICVTFDKYYNNNLNSLQIARYHAWNPARARNVPSPDFRTHSPGPGLLPEELSPTGSGAGSN